MKGVFCKVMNYSFLSLVIFGIQPEYQLFNGNKLRKIAN
jgi:hypothetical protein